MSGDNPKTDPLAAARQKLDSKIADAARDFVDGIHTENDARGGGEERLVKLTVTRRALDTLRLHVSAWQAVNEIGGGS